MNIKYIGMDIHKETISIAVMNGEGRVVMVDHRNQSKRHPAMYPGSSR
jgi:hypothetical protein